MTTTTTPPQADVHLEVSLAAVEGSTRRELTGLAVPYGEETDRPDHVLGTSRMRIDAAALAEAGAQLYYGHDHLGNGLPVGRVTDATSTDTGLIVTARVSETPKGDEVLTLCRDEVLTRFSIGFTPVSWHVEDEDDLLVYDDVEVFEVSVVPRPQYDSARIEAVLHQPPPTRKAPVMTETLDHTEALTALQASQDSLTQSLSALERQLVTLGESAAADGPPIDVPGHSYGEFLQMLSRGEPGTMDFLAYVGGVVGDLGDWVKDSWVGDIIRIVEKPRHAMSFFESGPLPATGMGVEFGKLLADTTDVDVQAAEGDVLPYGKVTFTTETASIDTYGGWGELSRQEIERAPINVVERFFVHLIRRYGIATENAVRTVLATATGAKSIAATDLTTADGWITFLVEAAAHLDDKGLAPEAVFVSKDVFIDLATLRDGQATDAPRLLNRDSGQVSVTGLTGDLFSVPVKMLGSLPADTVRVASSSAIKTFEAAGAPFRLQDEDITNLTKAFSCYGYLAVAAQEPDAIVVPGV